MKKSDSIARIDEQQQTKIESRKHRRQVRRTIEYEVEKHVGNQNRQTATGCRQGTATTNNCHDWRHRTALGGSNAENNNEST